MRIPFSRMTVFLALFASFWLLAFSIPAILFQFSRLLPYNYRYMANEALRAGRLADAEALVRARITEYSYDFDAYFILADSLESQRKPDEAAETMKLALAKLPAARMKKSPEAIGFDEPRILGLLSRYLWNANKYAEAEETARAALDSGDWNVRVELGNLILSTEIQAAPFAALPVASFCMKTRNEAGFRQAIASAQQGLASSTRRARALEALWVEHNENDRPRAIGLLRRALDAAQNDLYLRAALRNVLLRAGQKQAALAMWSAMTDTTGTRTVLPGQFTLPKGASLDHHGLCIGQNGTASAAVQTGVYRMTNLQFNARGTRALGMYPILVIKNAGRELARVYVDNPQPHLFDLALWPNGAPKNLALEFELINDVYDPFTRADRNVTISEILLY